MGRLVFCWSTIRPIAGGAPPPVPGPPTPPPPTPGVPSLVGTPPGAIPGSYWVEGSAWHFIASNGQEWSGTGSAVSTPPGAIPGSYWIAGDGFFYIDQFGVKRQLPAINMGAKPGGAITGSYWVNSPSTAQQQFQWIGGSNRNRFHNGF